MPYVFLSFSVAAVLLTFVFQFASGADRRVDAGDDDGKGAPQQHTHQTAQSKASAAVSNPYQHVFPWFDNTDILGRNDLLIKAMRQRHSISMFENIVPAAITHSEEGMLFMKDSPNRRFYWHSAAAADGSERRRAASAAAKKKAAELVDPSNPMLQDMVGVCLLYPNDYWNYQYCHRYEVTQFHSEMTEKGIQKLHDWSLGSFVNTTIMYKSGTVEHISNDDKKSDKGVSSEKSAQDKGDIVKVVDYYYGGQICHEVNAKRQTEVHIQCCSLHPKQHGLTLTEAEEKERHTLVTSQPRSMVIKLPRDADALTRAQASARQRRPTQQSQTNLGSSSDTQEVQLPYDMRLVTETDVCKYKIDICNNNFCKIADDSSSSADTTLRDKFRRRNGGGFANHDSTGDMNAVHQTVYQRLISQDIPIAMGSSNTEQEFTEYEMLSAILHHFSSTCMYRNNNYWNYEICINSHILQYHTSLDANHKPVVDSQFLLGNSTIKNILSEESIRKATSGSEDKGTEKKQIGRIEPNMNKVMSQIEFGLPLSSFDSSSSSGQPRTINLEFDGGTSCDLVNTNRSSTAQLACGPRDMIVDIIEDKTCHYLFKIHMSALCKVPGFAPKQKKYRELEMRYDTDFRPGQPEDDDEVEVEVEVVRATNGLDSRSNVNAIHETTKPSDAEADISGNVIGTQTMDSDSEEVNNSSESDASEVVSTASEKSGNQEAVTLSSPPIEEKDKFSGDIDIVVTDEDNDEL